MSTSSEIVDSGKFPVARSPEKSNFSQTCSLLSQYIKDKGTLADLSLGIKNDLPIARKASLTRFLEKRKDRIIAKGPYHIGASKPEESKAWLGLAALPSLQSSRPSPFLISP